MTVSLCGHLRELRVPPGMVALCSLGQAGFLLKGAGDTLVAVDPYLSDYMAQQSEFGPKGRWARRYPPPFEPEELDVDVILVTHEHVDHLDPETIRRTAAVRDVLVVGPPACAAIATGLGASFRPARVEEALELGSARVHPVPAAHAAEYTGPACYDVHVEDGDHRFLGYVVELDDGVAVYHGGDTVPHPEIDRYVAPLRPQVALLPINGRDAMREALGIVGNLHAREAAHLAAVAGARWLVPSHYDLFAVNAESVTTFVDVLDKQFPDQEHLVTKPGRPVVVGV